MATPQDWNTMLEGFLARTSTRPIDLDALRRLLTMTAENEPTNHLLPIDEAEIKLDYLSKLDRCWKYNWVDFTGKPMSEFKPLSPLIISTVMMMDVAYLRRSIEGHGSKSNLSKWGLQKHLQGLLVMPCFIKTVMIEQRNQDDHFLLVMGKQAMEEDEKRLPASERRQEHSSESYEDGKKKKILKPGKEMDRDDCAKLERRVLDNDRCVLTGMGSPEVCHIIPFSVNSKEDNAKRFKTYLGPVMASLFSESEGWGTTPSQTHAGKDPDDMDDADSEDEEMELGKQYPEGTDSDLFAIYCRRHFASRVGVSDRSWNEICLNRQLHRWWGQGFLALKPLGVDGNSNFEVIDPKGITKRYTRIKVQFHWMPRTDGTLLELSQDATPQNMSRRVGRTYGDLDLTDEHNPIFSQHHRCSVSHYLKTGDIFYVKVEARYAERMLTAFRLQWAAIKIFSMAGGAESLRDVGDHPDYLDEKLEWIGYRELGLEIDELMEKWDT